MSVVIPLTIPDRVPEPEDHVALRALLKYMSNVLKVGHKTIATDEPGLTENAVKSYANEKSSASKTAKEQFASLKRRCGVLIMDHKHQPLVPFVFEILRHLYGDAYIRAGGFSAGSHTAQAMIDTALARWHEVARDEIEEVERRYAGLWRVFRPSSPTGGNAGSGVPQTSEFNYSLLNIRPRSVNGSALCDFKWYYLGHGQELDERRTFEGFVLPNGDRIEFLGRITRGRSRPFALMVWRFNVDPELTSHAEVSQGMSLSLNTTIDPIGARVRAFFVKQSHEVHDSDFVALRDAELDGIGVKTLESVKDLIPADQFQRTVNYPSRFEPIICTGSRSRTSRRNTSPRASGSEANGPVFGRGSAVPSD